MKKIGKRILSLVLVACMIAPSIIAVANESIIGKFTDFPDDWSTQAVTAAVNNGLLHGYDDNTIRAEGLLTRAEMATVINNAFGAVIKADISAYKDVSPDAWYYDEIAKGVNMGTFIGAGDGYMYPDDPITREETFVVIARALVLSDENTASLDKFTDKGSISSWAINAIAALAARGYVNGDEASRVTPSNNITRAEFATLMDNIVKKYYSAGGTYTGTINGSVMINVGGVTLSNMVINGDLIIGDGVHTGEIRLENVTVNGRILTRGAQKPGKIYIVKSSVRDGIVVNNVNGTVYFDNYQSEIFFNNMLNNTPVEFKKPSSGGSSGGGGGGSSSNRNKWTVTFVLATDLNGNPTDTKVYKVAKGKTLKEQMGEDFVMPTANITYTQDGDSTNEYSHDVSQVGWFNKSKKEYTLNTKIESDVTLYPGWKNLSAKLETERFNVQGVNGIDISAYYEPNGRAIDAATDLVFANRGRVIKSINMAEDKVLERPGVQRFITPDKKIKMINLDMSFKDIFGSTANFKSLFQAQIDEALNEVPDYMRADVEDKIDEALVQIAEKKVWNLRRNNTIGINMPLSDIFGGEDNLRTMLKTATNDALNSVPGSMRDQFQVELNKVIEFIVASDPNARLDKDKFTTINDHLALNEFFGGKDAFADALKNAIASDISGLSDSNQDEINNAVKLLAGADKWSKNSEKGKVSLSFEVPLIDIIGETNFHELEIHAFNPDEIMVVAAIRGNGTFNITDSNETFVHSLLTVINSAVVDKTTITNITNITEIRNAIEKGFVDRAGVKDIIINAKSDYANDLNAAIINKDTFSSMVTAKVDYNISELFLNGMKDKISTIDYDDIVVKPTWAGLIDEDTLKDAFKTTRDAYAAKVSAVVDGRETYVENKVAFEVDINITKLVINGLIKKLEPLTFDDIKGDLGQDMIDLLGEDYLRDQFDISKTNMIGGINEAIDSESDKKLTGDIFRLKLGLDVYSLLLQQIDKQIGNMSYDLVSHKIPEQIKKVLGEEIIETQYNKVIDDFGARVDEAIVAIERGDTEVVLDCTLRISINLIDEILKPSYDRYLAEAEDKLGTYYTENENLVAIKELLTPDNLFDVDGEATYELSGYKLKDYDYYYDILEKVMLLSDGAIAKFSTDAKNSGNLEGLVSTYVDLGYDYYYRIVDLAKTALTYIDNINVDIDSILPSDETLESKRQSIKNNAVILVDNPDLTVQQVFENGFKYIDNVAERDGVEISENATWDNFVITIKKAKETMTIKNRTSIPEME